MQKENLVHRVITSSIIAALGTQDRQELIRKQIYFPVNRKKIEAGRKICGGAGGSYYYKEC